MRILLMAIGLTLATCGGAFADVASDCVQAKDQDLSIRGCTLIIEGRAKNYNSVAAKVAAYANRGNAYEKKGEYDRAIADYDQALRLDPKHANAYNGRGDAYNTKGEYDRAIADYDQALRLNPKDALAYIRRGNAYDNKGQYDRAIADLDQAIRFNPKDADAYYNRGLAYNNKGDYDRAIADYDQAIRLNPQHVNAYDGRGVAYNGKGEYDRAIADYDQAIRLNPRDANAYINRSLACNNKGDYDRAIADTTSAMELDPKKANAYDYRGDAYKAKGDYGRAIADYTKSIELDLKNATYLNDRGNAYYAKGEYDRAITDYDQAIRLDPKYALAYYNRGSAYTSKGEYDRAITDYDQAIRLDPKYANAYNWRGIAYHRKKDYERAVADYSVALPLSNDSGKGNIHRLRFLALDTLKRNGEALDDLLALAHGYPTELKRVTFNRITAAIRYLDSQNRNVDALDLLGALKRADYRGEDPLQLGDGLNNAMVEQLVLANKIDEAAPYVSELTSYENLLKLKVDKRFAALWSNQSASSLLHPQDFAARELAAAQKAAAKYPKSLKALRHLVRSLQLNGRYAEAENLGQTALGNLSAYDKDPESEASLRNAVAYVLEAQGRFEEATALLFPLLQMSIKDNNYLVNQAINLGAMLYGQGRFQEAVDTAQKAHGLSSPYGEMWIQSVSVCAMSRMGQTKDAEATLDNMLKTPEVNYRASLEALVCLGRDGEAAAMVIKMLEGEDSRPQILPELQDCPENPKRPAFARELRAAVIKIRERADVRKALDSAGAIVVEAVACGDR